MDKNKLNNKYDRMAVDVNSLFDTSFDLSSEKLPGYWKRLFNKYLTGALIKSGLYTRLVDAGFIRSWFYEFQQYWSDVLHGRPLYLHDFFYLLGVYRQRFQDVETPEEASIENFLDSWQSDDTLYMLFGAVRNYAYHPLSGYSFEKWVNSGDTILEYGCGIAPITKYLLNYSTKNNLEIDIADIRQINSHFARYCFGNAVHFFEIEPYKNPLHDKNYSVIFMITVMEHLPDPLKTIERITGSLKSKGVFIFDYILGDGDGQDTIEAVEQRNVVIDYIDANYDVLEGELLKDQSMGATVCRKK